jgi:3D (Asp-Asp-Asp) domain-containing protein/peptidoglycan hydrolase CwlO-like protein
LLCGNSRKNKGSAHPPNTGGIRVIRACALATCLLLLASALIVVSPASHRYGRALAQAEPSKPSQSDEAVKEVVTLDSEINGLKGSIASLEQKSGALGAKISSLGPQIEQRRNKLSARRAALAARARSIYVNGRTSKLVLLVSAENVSEMLDRNDMLNKVARSDARMIKTTRAEAAALQASIAELRNSKKEVDRSAAEARRRQQRLEQSRAEKQAVIAKAGANAASVLAQSGTVEKKMNDINSTRQAPMDPVSGRPTGRVMMMVATAYCPLEPGLDEHTASGMRATKGVVAVDPRTIPLGTRLNVEGYGNCIAGDTGGAIKGNRIDLCFDTLEEMNAYGGYRNVRVEILD